MSSLESRGPAVVLLAFLACIASPAPGSPLFKSTCQMYGVGYEPTYVVVADFNNDHLPDVASANSNGTVSVLFGDGTGSLDGRRDWPLGGQSRCLAVADLNLDGNVDLISANGFGNSISILLGNGDGSFGAASVIPLDVWINFVAAGDLDGDGTIDLVGATGSSVLLILGGDGSGSFPTRTEVSIGKYCACARLQDLNADGSLDLVATTGRDSLAVLLGRGDGTFALPAYIQTSFVADFFALGDLDGDGRTDLVALEFAPLSNEVLVLLGAGDGSFHTPRLQTTGSDTSPALAIGDLDGDGVNDVLLCGPSLSVLAGNGDGTLRPPSPLPANSSPRFATLADLNGDGRLDIVATNYRGRPGIGEFPCTVPAVVVLLGGLGGLAGQTGGSALPALPAAMALGDLNHDGSLDLVIQHGATSVLLGNGDGTFGAATSYGFTWLSSKLFLGDVDGDGNLDVITEGPDAEHSMGVILGRGDGTLGYRGAYLTHGRGDPIAAGDIDRDGHTDVVLASRDGDSVTVLPGKSGGFFGPPQRFATPRGPVAAAIGDVTGDGRTDLVVGCGSFSAQGSIAVLSGRGDGSFDPYFQYPAFGVPRAVRIADLDRNGKGDVVVATVVEGVTSLFCSTARISVYMSRDADSLAAPTGIGEDNIVSSLAVADLTGDGNFGVIAASALEPAINLYPGRDGHIPGAPVAYGIGFSPGLAAIGDVNGDGRPDVITSAYSTPWFGILLNQLPAVLSPLDVKPVIESGATTAFRLTWTIGDIGAVVRVRVQRRDTADSAFATLAEFTGSTPGMSYTDRTFQPQREYEYRVVAESRYGAPLAHSARVHTPAAAFALFRLPRNPVRAPVAFAYSLEHASATGIDVISSDGRRVRRLPQGLQPAGTYERSWDGKDGQGIPVSTGVYFLRIDSEGRSVTRKLLLVR